MYLSNCSIYLPIYLSICLRMYLSMYLSCIHLHVINICIYLFIYLSIYNIRLLNTAQGSLLDDEKLVNALQNSKSTALEVQEQLEISEQTEVKIDAAREVMLFCVKCDDVHV